MGYSTVKVEYSETLKDYEVTEASDCDLFDSSEWDNYTIKSVEKVDGKEIYFVRFMGNHFVKVEARLQ